jgi:YVTN family beta-propeller protein
VPYRTLSTYPEYSDKRNWTSDDLNAFGDSMSQGSVKDFDFAVYGDTPVFTDKNGNAFISNGRAPAYWDLEWLMPFECGTTNYMGQVYYDQVECWEYGQTNYLVSNYGSNQNPVYEICFEYGAVAADSTRFAILGNLPGTLTLASEVPFTTAYRMPLLYVYDGTRTVVVTEMATSVSSDGSQATFPFPSTLTQNGYSLAVVNQTNSAPGYSPASTNLLSIASSQTIAGTPFGVAAGGLTTITTEITKEGLKFVLGPTTTTYGAFPVVSLYSNNQLLIGSIPVNIGANPTAVATYAGPSVEQVNVVQVNYNLSEQITTTISGTTRAVVANSGSNSISILDIVNNVLLFNVPVGNQPVALAVSANGSTVYVANYTDSTVTQVNLNSGTATATIAVGGHPTSVALTAAGALWVGGVGFLTELNTQPLSVVATELVTGKTITALGFSDSVNQLVATSVDTSGNVYVDEINPSTVQAGGVYTPLASNLVSGLGTHINRGGSEVQAFTATLAGSSLISPNQAGAPPLVVQDGWAVVTATPTGFSITDITGQIVLVSEKTPSPVTAIAVDSKLNVAYLVMPDSNILLTVPLPGTN